MGISINTNVAATRAGVYLGANHANLQKSLDRLSSGKRITEPADDAGGLAVSMKLEHTGKVLRGVSNNLANAISFLQVQDGVLKSAGDIVSRMGELRAMYSDGTKNSTDQANYDSEFNDLQEQLNDMTSINFNDKALFTADGDDLPVIMDETGDVSFNITSADLDGINDKFVGAAHQDIVVGTGAGSVSDNTYAEYTDALEAVATLRATNGGQVRRLQYQLANVETQITNLSAANGRIMDVDIAAESANLARQQVLVQASAAMTAQANMSNDVALMLLQ